MTPITSTPRALLRFQKAAYDGISLMHGPHQVAQKSSRTTLPLSAAVLRVPPARSGSVKSGAGPSAALGGAPQARAINGNARRARRRIGSIIRSYNGGLPPRGPRHRVIRETAFTFFFL